MVNIDPVWASSERASRGPLSRRKTADPLRLDHLLPRRLEAGDRQVHEGGLRQLGHRGTHGHPRPLSRGQAVRR